MPRPVNPIRAAARLLGVPHFEGSPCAKGHTLRHTVSGACVACQAEGQRLRRSGALADQFADILG